MSIRFNPDVCLPLAMLRVCPAYEATPVTEIRASAPVRILVKDETRRMQLNSFKALGGVYAVAKYLQEQWRDQTGIELDPANLIDPEVSSWANSFTFVCASAGNHGMAVAKGAEIFNAGSRIHLASTVPESFAGRLRAIGAELVWSGETYEESMEAAQQDSIDSKAILIADSSWPEYLHLPSLIMEGYTVLAEELRVKFEETGDWPDYVFLQAGVGGMAAALSFGIRNSWSQQPELIIVEPDAAPCLRESFRQGKLVSVSGPVSTMGRLDCKTPSLLAFNTLRELANEFLCVSDEAAESARIVLKEAGIDTTASGAAGLAAVLQDRKAGLDIQENETVLIIATEGST